MSIDAYKHINNEIFESIKDTFLFSNISIVDPRDAPIYGPKIYGCYITLCFDDLFIENNGLQTYIVLYFLDGKLNLLRYAQMNVTTAEYNSYRLVHCVHMDTWNDPYLEVFHLEFSDLLEILNKEAREMIIFNIDLFTK